MTDIVSVREFARRIGVSLPAVQKAVKNGRITAVTDDNGKLKGIDWDTQKDAWVDNSNPAFRRNKLAYQPEGVEATPFPAEEGKNKGGRPRNDGKAPAPREGDVVEGREAQPHGGALKRTQTTPPPAGEMSLAEIKRARELILLNHDKLKLDEAKKKLVDADEVAAKWAKLITAAKTRILGIPAECKSRQADLSLDVIAVIDSVCREALEDLANGRD